MKRIILSLFVISFTFSNAQERHRFEVGTQAGYEHNYFKSPDALQVEGGLLNENELIVSSAYQDIYFEYNFRYKWKANRLRIAVSPFTRLFQENMDDSYWSVDGAIKYDHKFSKKIKLLGEINFVRMNREGLDGAQDVLVNPLGYTNYGASAGFELKPFKSNKTTVEGFYNFKDFDDYGTRDLEFNEVGGRISSKQQFRPGRYEHSYGFRAYYKKRLYETFNAESETPNGRRDWEYLKTTLFYELPVGEYFELEPQITYYGRFDRLEQQSGFNQYGPGVRLRFDNDKTKINAAIKYQIRDYTSIQAPGTQDLLTYSYTDLSLTFEHELPLKGLFFTGTAYSRFRETNTIDLTARSFRGYTNQYVGLGVTWKL